MVRNKINNFINLFPPDKSILEKLCIRQLERLYDKADVAITNRLDYELDIIKKRNLGGFFIMLWDIVNYAKSKCFVRGAGKGALNNSLVSYLLGITEINPFEYNLYFERFLNPSINNPLYIGMDFCPENSKDIINYTVSKYSKYTKPKINYKDRDFYFKVSNNELYISFLPKLYLIDKVARSIHNDCGITIDINRISLDDKKTLELFRSGNTDNIYGFEDFKIRKFLRMFKPDSFEDIVLIYTLYSHPLALRHGYMEKILESKYKRQNNRYPDNKIKKILEETYGIIIYQEQMMRIAIEIAGFSFQDADMLRRALCSANPERITEYSKKFIDNCCNKGMSYKSASKVLDLIVSKTGLLYNKGHSLAYSLISYRCGYLKAHFPEEFNKTLSNYSLFNN